MKKSYKISLLVITLLLVSSLLAGTSYSLWTSTHTQTTTNAVNIGCFTLNFTESGSNIKFPNAYPISDAKGLQTTPYEFTITNTCTIASSTSIAINMQSSSTMDSSYLNVAYEEGSNAVSTPVLLSSLATGEVASGDTGTKTSYILKNVTIGASLSKTYKIWLYIPETIGNDAQGKTFNAKVSIANYATDTYADETGASTPELYQGLIPVTYDASGNTVVANTSTEWYDYAKHNWANAV